MYDKLILKKLFGLFHLKQVGWSLPFFDCINLLQQKKSFVQKKIMGKKIDLCFLVSLTSMPRWKCTRRYDLSRSVNRPSLKAEKIKYKLIFLHCYFCIRHMYEIQDTLLFRTNLGKKNTPIPFKVHYRWFASYGFKTMEVVYLCRNLELQNKKNMYFTCT